MKRIIAITLMLLVFVFINYIPMIQTTPSANTAMPAQGQPFFSINSIEVTEGADPQAVFTVTLTYQGGFRDFAASVDYSTSNGTATAPGDYQQSSGTANFPPGQINSMTISIPIADDSQTEDAETFTVTLSNPQPAFVIEGPGTCTIRDNDQNEQEECSFSTLPTSQSFPGSGGTGTFRISAPSGCQWSVRESDSLMIEITSERSGSGSSTVSYTSTTQLWLHSPDRQN